MKRTDLRAVLSGQVVEGCFDGIHHVLQHARRDCGLADVDNEEVHGRLGWTHLWLYIPWWWVSYMVVVIW
jgi:hypothetical protein